jgi:hypothetical protein
MKMDQTRRDVLRNAAVCAAAASAGEYARKFVGLPVSAKEAEKEPEVTATEDLMREHGVTRRALLAYFESVPRPRFQMVRRSAPPTPSPWRRCSKSFVLRYENQAACEDTIIFPAWKKNFSNKQLDEISEQFEDIEHKMFGKDGFDDAEKKISSVEAALGFADLSQFTPPPPPAPKN